MAKLTRRAVRAFASGLLGLALLAGCDQQRIQKLEEGVSTEADVRREFGEPTAVFPEPDGSRTFEYPRQPEGWQNYFITIGPDGRMSALRQVLTDTNFARIRPGMDKSEVRRLLGRPAQAKPYPLKNEEVCLTRPISDLSRVVLPTPLRPSRVVTSPCFSSKDRPRRMWLPP